MSGNVTLVQENNRLSKASAIAIIILTVIAIVAALYVSKPVILPIAVAALVALFSSPVVGVLTKLKVPKPLAAGLVIVFLIVIIVYVLNMLAEPATRWLEAIPELRNQISHQINDEATTLGAIKKSVLPNEQGNNESVQEAVDTKFASIFSILAESTAMFIVQMGAVVVITYFFLVFGEDLLRNFVSAQNSFTEKKLTVSVFYTIRNDISHYVLVITAINICLGLVLAAILKLMGVNDPLLWGMLAALLNFAPYIGPTVLFLLLFGVGFVEYDRFQQLIILPGIYLVLNLIECQFVTPMLLGRRFNMNPLLLVIWMFLFGWMWGIVGMLISIPSLVCFKIIAKQTGFVGDWVLVMDGNKWNPRDSDLQRKFNDVSQ